MISELSVGALGGAKDAAIAWALRSGGRLERGGVLRLDRGFPDAWQLESLRNITCIMPQNMDSDGQLSPEALLQTQNCAVQRMSGEWANLKVKQACSRYRRRAFQSTVFVQRKLH